MPPRKIRSHSMVSSTRFALVLLSTLVILLLPGCSDDIETVREIQAERQSRMQSQTHQDHLGEAFSLLSRLVELNPDKAQRQIAYHLNRWREGKSFENVPVTEMIRTVSEVLPDRRGDPTDCQRELPAIGR